MESDRRINDEQTALWNGAGGRAWAEGQELLDGIFKPFEDLLAEFVAADPASCVLDVGCGAGATALAAARSLNENGRCIGIDISAPLVAVARARAERESVRAHFICGDAQTYAFQAAMFDTFISRFGIMFFENSIQAFANLHQAARDGARLRTIAWRSSSENPFMTAAERTAAPLLENLPASRPNAPGQFAFAEVRRVRQIFEESDWTEIDIKAIDVVCRFPEKDLSTYITRLGPVGRALDQANEQLRNHVINIVRAAFDSYVHGPEVRFVAACWMIDARA